MRHPHFDALSIRVAPAAVEATDPHAELATLVRRACRGDLHAQSALVRRYTARISGFIRTIVRDPSAVEDVAQTVFIKMIRRMELLRDEGAFESWLFAMARSTSLDYLRRAKRRVATTTLEAIPFDLADTSNTGVVNEILDALELALTHLSATDRRLVALVLQGHSYATIAQRERMSTGAVKARLCRVRPFLRAAVGEATGTRAPKTKDLRARVRCRLAA